MAQREIRQPVVTVAVLDMSGADLRAGIAKLRRVRPPAALVGLLVALLRVPDNRVARIDFSDRTTRARRLRAADRARTVLPASAVLKILGILSSRYNAWVRVERGCQLEDEAVCPCSTPPTPDDVRVIQAMVTSERYRHVPTGRLVILAHRMGNVFASPTT